MSTETDPGVRVVVAFEFFRVGQIIHPSGIYRDKLVKHGFCERIVPVALAKEEKRETLHLNKAKATEA